MAGKILSLAAGHRIAVTGSPLSGKTTIAKAISERYGLAHFSAGQIVRDMAKDWPELEAQLAKGETIDSDRIDNTILDLMREAETTGFVIDGFPRFPSQLWKMFNTTGITAMVWVETYFQRALQRAKLRDREFDDVDAIRKRFQWFNTHTRPIVFYATGMQVCNVLNFINYDNDPDKLEQIIASVAEALTTMIPSRIVKSAQMPTDKK